MFALRLASQSNSSLPRALRLGIVLVFGALLGLLLPATRAFAAPAAPLPCDPTNLTTNRCLTAQPGIAEHLALRAAGNGFVFAMAQAPGESQLRVLDAATLSTRGVIPLADTPLLYQADLLYTASTQPITPTAHMGLVLGVGNPDRPTLLGGFTLPFAHAVDWAISPGAIYALAESPIVGTFDLSVFSLADSARPRLVATVQGLQRSRLLVQRDRLYAAGTTGLTVFDATNPLDLQLLSSTELFALSPLAIVDVAAAGGVAYIMGRVALTGAPICGTIDDQAAAASSVAGDCPFLANKTTFAGGFAYVNPNVSPAEYLDYAVYSLADPAAPLFVGETRQRWRAAASVSGGLVVETFGGRIARLGQAANGALTPVVTTWDADALGLDGPVRATIGNLAVVDLGAVGADGERVLPIVDISEQSRPVARGALASPWIGARRLEAAGTRLYALHRNRLTLFDVGNPAAPSQVGQYTSSLGDPLEHLVLGAGNDVYLVSDHNTLLTVDVSTPTTPTLVSLIDLPESTVAAVRANNALYLFGPEWLLIVDVTQPARPVLVRSLPVSQPAAVTAWGDSLYLIVDGALQVLDISAAANPVPGMRVEPPAGMRFTALGPAQSGRIALNVLPAPGGGKDAVAAHVAIYDLGNPLAPRLAAVAPGALADAWFDGAHLLLPGPEVVAIGPGARFSAPVSHNPAEPTTITPGGPLPAGFVFTYSLAAGAVSAAPETATEAAAPATEAPGACLQQLDDPARPSLPPQGEAAYAGPFTLQVVDCVTGAPVAAAGTVTVTLQIPPLGAPPYEWPLASLFLDEGSRWTPVPGVQTHGNVWTATLTPPVTWGVRGPAPKPILLPVVAR